MNRSSRDAWTSSAAGSATRLRGGFAVRPDVRIRRDGVEPLLMPVRPEKLRGMLRTLRAVAARHRIGGAVFVATPARALRMRGQDREDLPHAGILPLRERQALDPTQC